MRQAAVIQERAFAEAGGVDHQGVAVPARNRVAQIQRIRIGRQLLAEVGAAGHAVVLMDEVHRLVALDDLEWLVHQHEPR